MPQISVSAMINKEQDNARIDVGGNRHQKTMSKKDNIENKVAVSASRPMNCSADEHQENAERETPEQRADKFISKFRADIPFLASREMAEFIAAEIREAIELERAACAKIAETDSVLSWVGGSTGSAKDTASNISKAIRSRSK